MTESEALQLAAIVQNTDQYKSIYPYRRWCKDEWAVRAIAKATGTIMVFRSLAEWHNQTPSVTIRVPEEVS